MSVAIEEVTPHFRSGGSRREGSTLHDRRPIDGHRRIGQGRPDGEVRLVLPAGDLLVVPGGDKHVTRRDYILKETLPRSRVQPNVDESEAVSPRLPRVPVLLEEIPVLRGAPLREPPVVECERDP